MKEEMALHQSQASPECCMCGDYGLSSELFRCKDCQFRYQHKYCSNLYPEADSYDTCNWCLSNQKGSMGRQDSSNSSSSSSQHRTSHQDSIKIKKKKRLVKMSSTHDHLNIHQGLKRTHNNKTTHCQIIKKPFSGDGSAAARPSVGRKLIGTTTDGRSIAERVSERSRSEDMMSNGGKMIKQVLRNKVIRRYKLLDEVSCQPVNANI